MSDYERTEVNVLLTRLGGYWRGSFHILRIETGWYFGKTAGLLGTLDNEPSDDMLSSNGYLEPDLFKFTESWSLNENSCGTFTSGQRKPPASAQIVDICDSYFKHKTSPLFTCFSVVLDESKINFIISLGGGGRGKFQLPFVDGTFTRPWTSGRVRLTRLSAISRPFTAPVHSNCRRTRAKRSRDIFRHAQYFDTGTTGQITSTFVSSNRKSARSAHCGFFFRPARYNNTRRIVVAADQSRPVLQPVPENGEQKRNVHVGDRVQRDVLHREPTGPGADELCQVSKRKRADYNTSSVDRRCPSSGVTWPTARRSPRASS